LSTRINKTYDAIHASLEKRMEKAKKAGQETGFLERVATSADIYLGTAVTKYRIKRGMEPPKLRQQRTTPQPTAAKEPEPEGEDEDGDDVTSERAKQRLDEEMYDELILSTPLAVVSPGSSRPKCVPTLDLETVEPSPPSSLSASEDEHEEIAITESEETKEKPSAADDEEIDLEFDLQ
jgi:hypothetical protein